MPSAAAAALLEHLVTAAVVVAGCGWTLVAKNTSSLATAEDPSVVQAGQVWCSWRTPDSGLLCKQAAEARLLAPDEFARSQSLGGLPPENAPAELKSYSKVNKARRQGSGPKSPAELLQDD